jgi:hypothetical protein
VVFLIKDEYDWLVDFFGKENIFETTKAIPDRTSKKDHIPPQSLPHQKQPKQPIHTHKQDQETTKLSFNNV